MGDPDADVAPPSTPRTARQRVREEVTSEILGAARAHLAREGAAGLSLRPIARDLGMAPSALYRYFDGRDALITALVLAAYRSLAAEAQSAADEAAADGGTDGQRFHAVPRALRRWALARPHEWGLVFGTPVPGYKAPEDTVEPYAQVAEAMVRPVVEAARQGRLASGRANRTVPAALRDAVAPVADGLFRDMPVGSAVLAVQAWVAIIGTISLEVFGHWRNTILDPEAFFEATVRDQAEALGLR